MLNIDGNNTITLTRGDTAYLEVNLQSFSNTDQGETFEISENDKLRLTVRKAVGQDILIQKVLTGSTAFHIFPEDTKSLPYGAYVYDVELTLENGDVFTVINVSKLKITQEVTY